MFRNFAWGESASRRVFLKWVGLFTAAVAVPVQPEPRLRQFKALRIEPLEVRQATNVAWGE